MRNSTDNLERRYAAFTATPGAMPKALHNFTKITDKTYDAFKSIIEEHPKLGKAAIVIMASNLASHLVQMANDETKSKAERIYNITGAIAPMYELMYDKLTAEVIDSLDFDDNAK